MGEDLYHLTQQIHRPAIMLNRGKGNLEWVVEDRGSELYLWPQEKLQQ